MKFFASLFFAMFLTQVAAAAPQSYPLQCRGGAGTLGVSTVDNSAVFFFTKSSGPANAGLAPGQCAWLDRPVSTSGEPTCLKQFNPGAVAWVFPEASARGNSYISSSTGKHWMRNLLDANNTVTFQAYNPGGGQLGDCFIVTAVSI